MSPVPGGGIISALSSHVTLLKFILKKTVTYTPQ
jgi:formiminotetrahydrofolate cyclodeaminase